ncbi:hypothetical protein KJ836_01265 [Patescibacteria group bacterium]|nr:hypothetical protein [Patescibacteria group bacterium]
MPTQKQNYFRQVALLLISLTIITIGVVYNQAVTSQSQAQFAGITTNNQPAPPSQNPTTTTTPTIPIVNQQPTNQPSPSTMPPPSTKTTPQTDTTPSIPSIPSTPSTDTKIDTGTNLPEITLEDLWISLQLLNKLTETPYLFAYNTPEINLPGISANTPASVNTVPDIAPSNPSASTTSPTNQPTDNEVITTIKNLTGYSKWEEFKTNFRTAQEQYANTGRCMIDIQGLGCLVQW